jgi:predicted phage tail protein
LAREFGKVFYFELSSAKDAIRAIDANKKNFSHRLINLARQGLDYAIVVDNKNVSEFTELEMNKEPRVIDLVPLVAGAGFLVAAVVAGAVTFLGATLAGVAAAQALAMAAVAAITTGLQMALAPKPEAPEPISATTRALQDSFTFSNKVNVASQGTPVPVGYGRLKVGSNVVQFCLKSFPQTLSSTETMATNPFELLLDQTPEPVIILDREEPEPDDPDVPDMIVSSAGVPGVN